MLLKTYYSILICFFTCWGEAKPSAPKKISKAAMYSNHFMSPKGGSPSITNSSVGKKAFGIVKSGAKGFQAETQAYFFMMALSVGESVRQKLDLAGVSKEKMPVSEIVKATTEAADHFLFSSEVGAGTAAMVGTKGTLHLTDSLLQKKPSQFWKSVFADAKLNPYAKQMLGGVAAMTLAFGTFEFGSELMQRSLLMLSDQDRKKAERMIPLIWKSLTEEDPNVSEDSKRIIAEVRESMLLNLQDEVLSEKLMSAFLRNRVQTGEFVNSTLLMASGAVLGAKVAGTVGSCIPNPVVSKIAAPAVGATIGGATAVAALLMPAPVNETVTRGFQGTRNKIHVLQMETSQIELAETLREIRDEEVTLRMVKRTDSDKLSRLKVRVDQILSQMKVSREKLMTTLFDQLTYFNTHLVSLNNRKNLALENGNTESANESEQGLKKYLEAYLKTQDEVSKHLGSESEYWNKMTLQHSKLSVGKIIETEKNTSLTLNHWTKNFLGQLMSTSEWGNKISPQQKEDMMSEGEAQALLERTYLWGFDQDLFIEVMESNN